MKKKHPQVTPLIDQKYMSFTQYVKSKWPLDGTDKLRKDGDIDE